MLVVEFCSISWQEKKCKRLMIDIQPITNNRDAILLNNYADIELSERKYVGCEPMCSIVKFGGY